MTFNPVIPLPMMIIICILLIVMKRKGKKFIIQLIVVALLFAINLRITIPSDNVTTIKNEVDVLFVIDNTISMLAEDYEGDGRRIDAVKENVSTIIDSFEGARFSLATFTDVATVQVPFTSETDLVLQAVDALNGQAAIYAQGTSLNVGADALEASLVRTSQHRHGNSQVDDYENGDEDRIRVVFFISDGEITDDSRLSSFEDYAELIDTGAVLGYGTRAGGQMHVREYPYSEDTILITHTGDDFSQIPGLAIYDEGNLQDISEDLGITYSHIQHASDLDEVLKGIQDQIDEGTFKSEETAGLGVAETYYFFAGALVIVLVVDFILCRRKLGKER